MKSHASISSCLLSSLHVCLCPEDMNQCVSPVPHHTFAPYSSVHLPYTTNLAPGVFSSSKARVENPRPACGSLCPIQYVMELDRTMLPHHKKFIIEPKPPCQKHMLLESPCRPGLESLGCIWLSPVCLSRMVWGGDIWSPHYGQGSGLVFITECVIKSDLYLLLEFHYYDLQKDVPIFLLDTVCLSTDYQVAWRQVSSSPFDLVSVPSMILDPFP